MRRLAFLFVVLSAGVASAGPKLGTFEGQAGSKSFIESHGVSDVSGIPSTVKFKVRTDRGRLYVSLARPGKRDWRNSFIIKSDDTFANGNRYISYERPANESRSGKYNLRQQNSDVQPGKNAWEMMEMSGRGYVFLKPDGTAEWKNSGFGTTRPSAFPESHGFHYAWDESFAGARANDGAAPSQR
jgi:hypothetical protein